MLECSKRLSLASEHKIAHWPSFKIIDLGRKHCTHTNTGAELFVGFFQPRRYIDCIAIGRVVEESGAAKVANDGWPRMSADPGNTKRDALSAILISERLCVCIESQSAADGTRGVVRLLARGTKQHM